MLVSRHILKQVFATCAACINIFLTGVWYAWPAVILPKLKSGEIPMTVTEDDMSWMTALLDLGTLVGSYPIASYLTDRVGRIATLQISAIGFVFASLLALNATSTYLFYVARFLAGINVGFSYTAAPTYVAEIANSEIRGTLTSIAAFFFRWGSTFTITFGPFMTWKTLHWITLILPFGLLVFCAVLPESPYFFFMQGKAADAEKAFNWFRDERANSASRLELLAIKERVAEEKNKKVTLWTSLTTRKNRRALTILFVSSLVYGLGGICSITDYSSTTLPNYGFWDPTTTTIILGWSQLLSNILSLFFIDTWGRKPLMLISVTTTGLLEGFTAAFYYFNQNTPLEVERFSSIPHLSNVLVAFSVSFALEKIVLIYRSELFPTDMRGTASGLSVAIDALCFFLSNKIFFTVGRSLGFYAMYSFFSAINLFGAAYMFFSLVETKGKTFAEIQEILLKPLTN